MDRIKKAKLAKMTVVAVLVAILALTLFPGAASAESESLPSNGHQSIAINNGIINVDVFGDTYSQYDVWVYGGNYQVYQEYPAISYGANPPVYLSDGTVVQWYPDAGVPDRWYWAKILLDLNGDTVPDVAVNRGIMVPSRAKFFYVKYVIQNLGTGLSNFRFFEGVDYDVAENYDHNEGGYNAAGDYVWGHDPDVGTWVGFKGDLRSAHHSVAYYEDMWTQVTAGVLNDSPYYGIDDVGVAMQWNLWMLRSSYGSAVVTLKFAFADSRYELNHLLAPNIWLR